MILRMFAIFACAAALFFAACTNSDDFLYNESESIFIDVSAEMAFSFDTISKRSKSDTLSPNDTLIFIANILPSKSIKIKRYLWTLDGTPLSYDLSKDGFLTITLPSAQLEDIDTVIAVTK